mmetsp:Transcript_37352/g.74629  ORF Transcript_37352/g.74629 Transcript_37352/m.74629 type:complete len:122 (-) Transcript_37352:98-463(-)
MAGDWYVGVQALPDMEAEFSLTARLVEPPYVAPGLDGHVCDPNAPECRGPLLIGVQSSAQRSRGGNGRAPLLAAVAASCGLVLVSMRAASQRRRAWRRGGGAMGGAAPPRHDLRSCSRTTS